MLFNFSALIEIAWPQLYSQSVQPVTFVLLPQGAKPLKATDKVRTLGLNNYVVIASEPKKPDTNITTVVAGSIRAGAAAIADFVSLPVVAAVATILTVGTGGVAVPLVVGLATQTYTADPRLGTSDASRNVVERDEQICKLQRQLDRIYECKEKIECISQNTIILDLSKIVKHLPSCPNSYQKEEALDILSKTGLNLKSFQCNLSQIDFTKFDLKSRCEELIQRSGPHGFRYTVGQVMVKANAVRKVLKFGRKSQYEQSKTSCFSIREKRVWFHEVGAVGLAYGGISNALQEYSNRTNIDTPTANTAIVTTKELREVAVFQCESVTVEDEVLDMARKIGKEKTEKQREIKALEFLNKYPAVINMGLFSVGCWFAVTAATSSSESLPLEEIQNEAVFQSLKAIRRCNVATESKATILPVVNGSFTSTFEQGRI